MSRLHGPSTGRNHQEKCVLMPAAVPSDVPKRPKTEFHTVYESAQEFCRSFLLRIDQNSSG
jgi:hypothetical protein